jgi:hypothetical protein
MLPTNIEKKVAQILEKKGKAGWLRVQECTKEYAKEYVKDPTTGVTRETINASEETKFYRWRKQVEKNKVKGFQILKLPGNISFIGLEDANPSAIKSMMEESHSGQVRDYGSEYMWKLYNEVAEGEIQYDIHGNPFTSYSGSSRKIVILAEMNDAVKEEVVNFIKSLFKFRKNNWKSGSLFDTRRVTSVNWKNRKGSEE